MSFTSKGACFYSYSNTGRVSGLVTFCGLPDPCPDPYSWPGPFHLLFISYNVETYDKYRTKQKIWLKIIVFYLRIVTSKTCNFLEWFQCRYSYIWWVKAKKNPKKLDFWNLESGSEPKRDRIRNIACDSHLKLSESSEQFKKHLRKKHKTAANRTIYE